ncbi:MAG: glycosyltransferase [Candidatus Micrarchaeota archaeon]
MRIAFITDTFHPMVDGITRTSTALGAGIENIGHEVHYWAVTTRWNASYPDTTYYLGTAFPPYPDYAINIFSPSFESSILGFAPDIIHIQSPGGLGLQALDIAKRNRIPCVFTYHTNLIAQMHYLPFSKYLSPAYKHLIRVAVRHFSETCGTMLAPSRYAQNLLREFGIRGRIIPNAVDTVRFSKKRKNGSFFADLVGAKHDKTVLVVGRVISEKNLDAALLAAQELVSETSFIFVGTGPYEKVLRRKAQEKDLLGKNVFFCGRVDDETLVDCYSNASLLFFPSEYDTFGLVAVEALACGLSVVAPAGSAQMEIYDKTGVTSYKPGKEIDTIRNVLEAKVKIPTTVINGIRKKYDKKNVANAHLRVYRDIIEKG